MNEIEIFSLFSTQNEQKCAQIDIEWWSRSFYRSDSSLENFVFRSLILLLLTCVVSCLSTSSFAHFNFFPIFRSLFQFWCSLELSPRSANFIPLMQLCIILSYTRYLKESLGLFDSRWLCIIYATTVFFGDVVVYAEVCSVYPHTTHRALQSPNHYQNQQRVSASCVMRTRVISQNGMILMSSWRLYCFWWVRMRNVWLMIEWGWWHPENKYDCEIAKTISIPYYQNRAVFQISTN